MGAVLTAALGQTWGKVGVEKLEMPPALPPKGPIFGRTQRRYYFALGPFLRLNGPSCWWLEGCFAARVQRLSPTAGVQTSSRW